MGSLLSLQDIAPIFRICYNMYVKYITKPAVVAGSAAVVAAKVNSGLVPEVGNFRG